MNIFPTSFHEKHPPRIKLTQTHIPENTVHKPTSMIRACDRNSKLPCQCVCECPPLPGVLLAQRRRLIYNFNYCQPRNKLLKNTAHPNKFARAHRESSVPRTFPFAQPRSRRPTTRRNSSNDRVRRGSIGRCWYGIVDMYTYYTYAKHPTKSTTTSPPPSPFAVSFRTFPSARQF